jgi:hypothetical protein
MRLLPAKNGRSTRSDKVIAADAMCLRKSPLGFEIQSLKDIVSPGTLDSHVYANGDKI